MTALEQAWETHRRVAFDVAYRLLGSVADAEDAVQEAYARLSRTPVEEIADVRAIDLVANPDKLPRQRL